MNLNKAVDCNAKEQKRRGAKDPASIHPRPAGESRCRIKSNPNLFRAAAWRLRAFAFAAAVLLAAGTWSSKAQESKPDPSAKAQASATKPPADPKPKLSQEELEAKFKATLTKATLSGRWCGIKEGKLTPEQEDKYTIVSVNKLGGEVWVFNARIQYGEKDFTVPLPVQVKWAGDTPVITVDDMAMPGGKTAYSARVLIFDQTYAGTWSGGDHGGLMHGIITHEKE